MKWNNLLRILLLCVKLITTNVNDENKNALFFVNRGKQDLFMHNK